MADPRDHSKCGPNAHTRDAPDNTRQIGDQDSDGQLGDQHGDILCNDCTAPLVWCETFNDYFHLDPDAEPCFLTREALNRTTTKEAQR